MYARAEVETELCPVTADPLGNQAGGWWISIAVNEQPIQPNVCSFQTAEGFLYFKYFIKC